MKQMIQFLSWVKPYSIQIVSSVLLALLFSTANIYFLPLTEDLVDALNKKDMGFFHNQIFNAMGLVAIRFGTQFIQFYLVSWICNKLVIDLRLGLYSKLQGLSNEFYRKWKLGDIISRCFTDVKSIQNGIQIIFKDLLPQIVTFIGIIGYLLVTSWKLTAFTLITLPVFVAIISRQKNVLKRSMNLAQRQLAGVTHILQESIQNTKLVQAYTMEDYEYQRLSKESNRNFVSIMKGIKIRSVVEFSISFLQLMILILIIWIGGIEITKGNLEGAQLASFFMGLLMLIDPIILLSKVFNKLQLASVSAERYNEIMTINTAIKSPENPHSIPVNPSGQLSFRQVSFSYESNTLNALDDISLEIKPNSTVALVGSSGSGKTSLMNMIPRFTDPTGGDIFFDDINLKDLDPRELRKHIAWVPQDDMLFRGTILENIRYGSPDAKEKEIIDAAKHANAWTFINELPNGLRTQLADMGQGLSGGQKQRISIARALLKNPKILLLDEATSALDSESEKLVQEALNSLMKNRTTLVIAHRLSTIKDADNIIVMDKGKIVETGTHQTLLDQDGHYARLYNLQFKSEPHV